MMCKGLDIGDRMVDSGWIDGGEVVVELTGFKEVSEVLSAGVYALVKRGVVIYVGKSKSMYQRIYAHRTTAARAARGKSIPTWLPIKGFVFDQVFVCPCRLDELDEVESLMINKYKPRFNESLKNGLKVKAPITLRIAGAVIAMNAVPPLLPSQPGIRRV